MKNHFILFGALGALLLAGCEKDPKTKLPDEQITFAPSLVTTTSEEPAEIRVFAFGTGKKTWEEEAATATPGVMYNQLLQKTGEAWDYTPAVNWPGNKTDRLSFFAYAGEGVQVSAASAEGVPVLTYDIKGTPAQTDILLATPALDLTRENGAVALEMRSVMAKVGFRLQGNGEQVSKIAVRGIREKGTITLDKANEENTPWTLSGDAIEFREYRIGLAVDTGETYVSAPATMTDVTANYLYLMPQNLTYNARIVLTVDGKEIGLPFETVFQLMPGREYIVDLNIGDGLPLDWTDNASASLLLAPTDALAAANVTKAAAQADCEAAGYRLPTYNEGLLILTYMNGIENNAFRYASYWASTWYKTEDTYWLGVDASMGYDISNRYGVYMGAKDAVTAARCVKDGATGQKYPYVDTSNTDGPIIVSRDGSGGVIPSTTIDYGGGNTVEYTVFHNNWTVTPEGHLMGSDDDRISRKLQVANADAAEEMVARSAMACAEGWRTPTFKELQLIYAMGGGETATYDTDATGNFYNPAATDTALNSVAGFTPMQPNHYWAGTMVSGRSGLNPISLSFAETGIYGQGYYDTTTYTIGAYVRCVKDVE